MALPKAMTRPILAAAVEIREIAQRPLQLGQQVVEHAAASPGTRPWDPAAVVALRFRCSALAKVSFNSLVSALVKWLPPSGMLRCQTRKPLVTTRSVASVPSETTTTDSGGFSGSYSSADGKSPNWSKTQEVVQRQRRELDDVDLDAGLPEWLQGAEDGVALHGEQADLGLQGKPFLLAAAAHPLVVPNDVVQVEGDLLPGLVADDVGNLLRLRPAAA